MNLEAELFSQSQGYTQKSLCIAQQRARKVRFGNAAASSSRVLSFTRQWLKSCTRVQGEGCNVTIRGVVR